MNYIVGVDIGGTFTDCVVVDETGSVAIGKSLSTPADFSQGALNASADAAKNLGLGSAEELLASTRLFFHACTMGDNTLITRAGAKTGLILTKGFGDTLHMMRGKIAEGLTENEIAHRSALDKPEPFVPRNLVEEIPERVDYKGAELIRLDVDAAERALDRLAAKGVESVAVCFLWSILNDAHEKQLAAIIQKKYPKLYFTLSSEVAPYLGEYERAATTVFNAYIGPKISSYLQNLKSILRSKGLKRDPLIMQAYGGVLDIEATCKNAVGTIESGPAAGSSAPASSANISAKKISSRQIWAARLSKSASCATGSSRGTTSRCSFATAFCHLKSGSNRSAPEEAALPGSTATPVCSKSDRKAPARSRGRYATMSAAASRPFPTPTWFWVISTPSIFSAAR